MFSRVVRLKGDANRTDEALALWKESVLPVIKKQKGYAGVSMLRNRKTGDGLSVSYWETEQAMKESRDQIRPEALRIMASTGDSIVEENECEVAVMERFQPPKANVWVRLTTIEGDPSKIDKGIADYKSAVVPTVQKQAGARAAILLVDRKAGKSFSGTLWETERDLQNSEAAVSGLRKELADKVGDKGPRVEAFEIAFTEILTPAALRR
jgi:heme-degrading monooxygenase HmoA